MPDPDPLFPITLLASSRLRGYLKGRSLFYFPFASWRLRGNPQGNSRSIGSPGTIPASSLFHLQVLLSNIHTPGSENEQAFTQNAVNY